MLEDPYFYEIVLKGISLTSGDSCVLDSVGY